MTQTKRQAKIYVANIMLNRVLDCLIHHDLTPHERAEFEQWRTRLDNQLSRLLHPKPRTPKPSSTATEITGITSGAKLKGRG